MKINILIKNAWKPEETHIKWMVVAWEAWVRAISKVKWREERKRAREREERNNSTERERERQKERKKERKRETDRERKDWSVRWGDRQRIRRADVKGVLQLRRMPLWYIYIYAYIYIYIYHTFPISLTLDIMFSHMWESYIYI